MDAHRLRWLVGAAFVTLFASLLWWYGRTGQGLAKAERLPSDASSETADPEPSPLNPAVAAVTSLEKSSPAVPLFRLASPVANVPSASPVAGEADPSIPVKRVMRRLSVEISSLGALLRLSPGQTVSFPLFDGQMARAKVVLVRAATDQDPAAISGRVETPFAGSFALVDDPRLGWRGVVIPQSGEVAYEFETAGTGEVSLDEVPRGDVVCHPMPAHRGFVPARKVDPKIARARTAGRAAAVPVLRSRPGAKGTLFLDFDGATVTDPFWNDGNTIVAEPSGLSDAKITDVWKVIAEDFLPFDVNVTTVEGDYTAAKQGMRMRCIFTPTTDAMPGSGGVAYLGSFKWSGTTPCWGFNGTGSSAGQSWAVHVAAMTGSHEFGHTFNLLHDGDTSQSGVNGEYYGGHGTGATSWGPIMGAPFSSAVIQWSKGEYATGNNPEDDVAIISGSFFGVGYVTDDYPDSISQAGVIPQSTKGTVAASGLIHSAGDRDVFRMECGKGTVTIAATVASPEPNLDLKLELLNGSGAVVKSEDPAGIQTATLSAPISTQGTYYLRVASGAEPDGSTTGWTTYGSLGAYALTGSFPSMLGFADRFAEAASLPSGFSFSGLEAANTAATAETGEPAHAGSPARRSLWWKWTPSGFGRMTIDTRGSSFDTVLAVYTGSALNRLTAVASNNNVHPLLTYSRVQFPVVRGTTYYIAVDGVNGASGNILLNGSGSSAAAPANDGLTSATLLTGSSFVVRGSSFNASREEGEPEHRESQARWPYSGYCSVWYMWTAPASGTYLLSTEGSSFDTLLGIYTGPASGDLTPGSLVKVGGSDNAVSGQSWSRLKFSATAGKTYYIAIDGAGRRGGAFVLALRRL